jgi:predicted membrane channel-forming protein YqfA (hemolysin III family)
MDYESRFNGAGGTPGGIVEFFIGLGMTIAGGYLLTSQVTVTSGFWSIYGYNAFGLTLLPLVFGIGILFFNGKSIAGWLLLFAGIVIIFAGIITNLQIYFQPTSLFNTIMMLILLAGGIGLVARSLVAHKSNL